MIPVAEALAQVLALVGPLAVEDVPIAEAGGRVLARAIAARRDQPPFASSMMDGYALRDEDARPGAGLTVIGEAAAGRAGPDLEKPGQAVRIFTGAPVPRGATRVVIQEDVTREGDRIVLGDRLDAGPYIRSPGADFRAGDTLSAPRRLRPADILVAAAMNHAALPCARRPDVALIATGDELVMPGEAPAPDQIVTSNTLALKALIEAEGGAARLLPIARDRAEALDAVFDLARGADLIVTVGGASVGEHDLVARVAASRGMVPAFHRVAMRPGKPLMAGRIDGVPMLGLPGNPVSAMVCGIVFLVPALHAMLGLPAGPAARLRATLGAALGPNGAREHYMRARFDAGRLMAFDRQDSALTGIFAEAQALIVRPPDDPPRARGDEVDYLPL